MPQVSAKDVAGWVSWYLSAYVDDGVFGQNGDPVGDLPVKATQDSQQYPDGYEIVLENGQRFMVRVEELPQ